MVSIIARPTKRVREIVPAASGWRAIASIAEATALPSPRPGPIAPRPTASAAEKMLTAWMRSFTSCRSLSRGVAGRLGPLAHGGADENGRENREDVSLHRAGQQIERHQRDRHEEAGERENDANDEDAAHHVAEQAHDQGESAGELLDDVERNHHPGRLGVSRQIPPQAPR